MLTSVNVRNRNIHSSPGNRGKVSFLKIIAGQYILHNTQKMLFSISISRWPRVRGIFLPELTGNGLLPFPAGGTEEWSWRWGMFSWVIDENFRNSEPGLYLPHNLTKKEHWKDIEWHFLNNTGISSIKLDSIASVFSSESGGLTPPPLNTTDYRNRFRKNFHCDYCYRNEFREEHSLISCH